MERDDHRVDQLPEQDEHNQRMGRPFQQNQGQHSKLGLHAHVALLQGFVDVDSLDFFLHPIILDAYLLLPNV